MYPKVGIYKDIYTLYVAHASSVVGNNYAVVCRPLAERVTPARVHIWGSFGSDYPPVGELFNNECLPSVEVVCYACRDGGSVKLSGFI